MKFLKSRISFVVIVQYRCAWVTSVIRQYNEIYQMYDSMSNELDIYLCIIPEASQPEPLPTSYLPWSICTVNNALWANTHVSHNPSRSSRPPPPSDPNLNIPRFRFSPHFPRKHIKASKSPPFFNTIQVWLVLTCYMKAPTYMAVRTNSLDLGPGYLHCLDAINSLHIVTYIQLATFQLWVISDMYRARVRQV